MNYFKERKINIKSIALTTAVVMGIITLFLNITPLLAALGSIVTKVTQLLTPLIWGVIITLVLRPVMGFYERMINKMFKKAKLNEFGVHTKSRVVSCVLAIITLILALFLLLMSVSVLIGGSVKGAFSPDFLSNLSTSISNAIESLTHQLTSFSDSLKLSGVSNKLTEYIPTLMTSVTTELQNMLANFTVNIASVVMGIVQFFIGFVFAANILISKEYFIDIIDKGVKVIFKKKQVVTIKKLAGEIVVVLDNFVTGQLIDLTLNSIMTSVALFAIGYPSALLLGFFAGFTNIIPYLGSVLGIIPVFIVGLANGGFFMGLGAAVFVLIIQQLYITFVTPRVQGDRLGIHPLFILTAVAVFGGTMGLVGMIIATPLTGVIFVFIKHFYQKRLEQLEKMEALEETLEVK